MNDLDLDHIAALPRLRVLNLGGRKLQTWELPSSRRWWRFNRSI
jgi:hypothetical protein